MKYPKEGRIFFFEKRSKKLLFIGPSCIDGTHANVEKFFGSFFQKRTLSSFGKNSRPIQENHLSPALEQSGLMPKNSRAETPMPDLRRMIPLIAAIALPTPLAAQGSSEQITVIGTSPLLGAGVDRDLVPAETNVLSSADIARDGTPDLLNSLNEQIPGLSLDSASGNPYQPSLLYHGFNASPLQGSEQGLAVYVNGERFNQPFGDTVNWELIPAIAIAKLNLEGANPVFGLNALGGSLNVALKNGFTYTGLEADVSGGSFGQVQGEFQYGKAFGSSAVYVAGSELHQGGWRDLQSSDIQNFYADVGHRSDASELHFALSLANSVLNGPGTSPIELLAADPAAQFTAPNAIANRYISANLNGNFALSDTLSLQGVAYYQYLQQRVVNGNSANDTPCDDGSALLCSDPGVYSTTRGGGYIPAFLGNGPYSELDVQTTNTNGYGASAQITDTGDLFWFKNHAVAGVSFDGAQTMFSADGYIGGLTPVTRIYIGPGVLIDEPGNDVPVRVAVSDAYAGAFASDTITLLPALSLTVSGRFNNAEIDLADQNGGDLTGQHSYSGFNPAAGITYKAAPWLTAYASYSEANRAPTPAELSCASPADSCSLANFFTGDPNLKQVIAHTVEAGVRGGFDAGSQIRATYDLSLYHTDLEDDIAFINSVTTGRAYFQNIGQTRRQGLDADIVLQADHWRVYFDYSFTDATYQTSYVEDGGSNPDADANGNITIRPGDRLPGVPANQIKFGVSYQLTKAWLIGGSGIYQSGQYLFGDDANLTPRLPGFVTANFYTSYQLLPHVQLFGQIQNIGDARYYTYGTFSPTGSVFLSQAPTATNPRSYSPAAPVGGFGGLRVTF
jgi:outer membrane receptor protein involved in Fe transport